ncbi:SDR family NAD(P)-dependent oxidoreductase [Nocardia pseudobrasiliensis]|uniref:NAD(P)-dependent dehydrogenase (Short-subunit alcohol dehydrogenase family) n=1 Tax=Nocardia pseudobrasiliensis TaxID=45979 RepID=A0A370IBW2_9NOCA|nr:SDR family oxidoreductase [Nocardia pseudobrasiliensis]RDI68216.1 NAD(P)-dependent dehydrogenase (short-subunit alcohol dehydrogenase family) [Nocardia pseudobrasiliensis]
MRRVLVTGASRGIGRAVASAFAVQGDRVAVHYGADTAAATRTLESLPGSGHIMVTGDLGNPDTAQQVADTAVRGLGGIDVLVNNAAVATSPATQHSVADTDYAQWQHIWRKMIDVNLLGAVNLTYCVARHLIDRSAPGSVVNVGSRGAFRGEPDFPAYAASKAGLHTFGQSMAVALAPHGISVTSVAPGFVGTERQQAKLASAEGDAVRAQSPFGRVGTPAEIASAVLYLASPQAQWASGTVLDLNGASYLRT